MRWYYPPSDIISSNQELYDFMPQFQSIIHHDYGTILRNSLKSVALGNMTRMKILSNDTVQCEDQLKYK